MRRIATGYGTFVPTQRMQWDAWPGNRPEVDRVLEILESPAQTAVGQRRPPSAFRSANDWPSRCAEPVRRPVSQPSID